jgi:hypothetical protein
VANTRNSGLSRTAVVAAALLAAAWAAPAALAQDRAAPMDPSFEVVFRKSIFSRDRSRPDRTASTNQTRPAPTPLTPEQSVAFRGVLCPDEEYVAFIENVVTGQISILKVGDEIARGRVAGITLDTLAYDAGGTVHKIQLGQNLAGEIAASTSGGTSTTSPAGAVASPGGTTGTTGASTPPSDASQAAVIERMKQQRRAQGGN